MRAEKNPELRRPDWLEPERLLSAHIKTVYRCDVKDTRGPIKERTTWDCWDLKDRTGTLCLAVCVQSVNLRSSPFHRLGLNITVAVSLPVLQEVLDTPQRVSRPYDGRAHPHVFN